MFEVNMIYYTIDDRHMKEKNNNELRDIKMSKYVIWKSRYHNVKCRSMKCILQPQKMINISKCNKTIVYLRYMNYYQSIEEHIHVLTW